MKKFTSFLTILVVIVLTLLFSVTDSFTQPYLYKLKSIATYDEEYFGPDLIWEDSGLDKTMYQQANGRTIILSFWGTWCGYCMRHLPELVKLYDYLPKNEYYFINAVGEYTEETENVIRQVLIDNEVPYENVWYAFNGSTDLQAHVFYGVNEFITTLVISPEKKVIADVKDIIFESFLDTLNKISPVKDFFSERSNTDIYPNPINSNGYIRISLPNSDIITIKLLNNLGEEIFNVFEGYKEEGNHIITFNVDMLPNGIYYYTIINSNFNKFGKLVIAK